MLKYQRITIILFISVLMQSGQCKAGNRAKPDGKYQPQQLQTAH